MSPAKSLSVASFDCKMLDSWRGRVSTRSFCGSWCSYGVRQIGFYHSMKGKKKDDNGKPKSASESMRTNQLADLLAHVEAGMVDGLFWISVEESEGSSVLIGALLSYKILMCLFFFQSKSRWFCYLYVHFLMTLMNTK